MQHLLQSLSMLARRLKTVHSPSNCAFGGGIPAELEATDQGMGDHLAFSIRMLLSTYQAAFNVEMKSSMNAIARPS